MLCNGIHFASLMWKEEILQQEIITHNFLVSSLFPLFIQLPTRTQEEFRLELLTTVYTKAEILSR